METGEEREGGGERIKEGKVEEGREDWESISTEVVWRRGRRVRKVGRENTRGSESGAGGGGGREVKE